jgi:MFS family permease
VFILISSSTFFGAIIAGDLADFIGRRFTIILGCLIFTIGGILETASSGLGVMVAGRLIAGFGVGFISSVVILYMSEIAPKKVRGAVVAGKLSLLPAYEMYIDFCRLSILHYHRYLAGQLRRVRYSEPP